MKRSSHDTYDCKEMVAFWRTQPGGVEGMPEHVKDFIKSQNGGIWPPECAEPHAPQQMGAGEDCPF